MNHPPRAWRALALPALLAAPLLVSGCASTADAAAARSPGGPPQTALMVCGEDIASQVVQVLELDGPPHTESSWADPVYTCTYHLPVGPMVLSVQVADDDAAAGDLFEADRARLAPAQQLYGLGERAFGTADGVTVVVKDDQVLTVDTTALPAVFGPDDQRRTDLANEIASDVLGCWTGHE